MSSRAASTIRVFGYYLVVLGIVLVAVPNLLLSLFLMPETREVWIRVVGLLVFILGVYYLSAAQSESTAFFRASVFARTLVLVTFAVFAVLGLAEPTLVGFGVVDFIGGLWTWRALKSERSSLARTQAAV